MPMTTANMERIFRHNYSALLAFTTKLTLGDVVRAEDIVGETMLRAWQHIDALTLEVESARPWLFRVARNILIDQLRAGASRPAEVHAELFDRPAVAANDAMDQALSGLEARSLLTALPAHHRDVLICVYLRERSTEETAALLGIPRGTVKSRTHHALRSARRLAHAPAAVCQASRSWVPALSSVDAVNPA